MNHNSLSLIDKINTLGELEHIRRHARRSAKTTSDPDKRIRYEVYAKKAQTIRRSYQATYLQSDELDWCLVKSAATLKQLINEAEDNMEFVDLCENLADEILSDALGEDVTGCEACKKDMEQAS